MRALILAGGYGQRLKPLTDNIPKCLVKVQNKSLLKLWYEKLISIGINEIYYNSHYKHEMVNKFVNDHNLKMINLILLPLMDLKKVHMFSLQHKEITHLIFLPHLHH